MLVLGLEVRRMTSRSSFSNYVGGVVNYYAEVKLNLFYFAKTFVAKIIFLDAYS